MSFKDLESEKRVIIKIDKPMTIYEIMSIRDEWIDSFENHDCLVLDLSEVTDCDLAGVQLLFSAMKTASDTDKLFSVSSLSKAVSDTLIDAGLDPTPFLSRHE